MLAKSWGAKGWGPSPRPNPDKGKRNLVSMNLPCVWYHWLLFSHRNQSKVVNYRLMRDGGCYIYKNKTFPSIPHLIDHYKTTPITTDVNARLINPVLSLLYQQPDEIHGTVEICKSYSQITCAITGMTLPSYHTCECQN
jgi:hypothetical protein